MNCPIPVLTVACSEILNTYRFGWMVRCQPANYATTVHRPWINGNVNILVYGAEVDVYGIEHVSAAVAGPGRTLIISPNYCKS